MQFKTIIGWVLLAAGLIIIFYSLYSSYNIFTAKTAVPEIFKIEAGEEIALSQRGEIPDIEVQAKKMIIEQLRAVIPGETLSQILNLISWSIFAGILIFGGAQISNLGIRLIKK